MAGYGAAINVDMKLVAELPTGGDPASAQKRRRLFQQTDMNGNGILSLAECDRMIVTILKVEGLAKMKPVINRAFHAARDIVPPVGDFSPHYVDFHEFKYFLIYIQHYLDLFILFDQLDQKDGGYSDRRLAFKEFKSGVPLLLKWGLDEATQAKLKSDPAAVWKEIDDNEGGIVLFDEFAHWALYHHLFALDGNDDAAEAMAEALEVLKKQKPNLCGKDLKGIHAAKAKYRADAPIYGQGCLRGESSIASEVGADHMKGEMRHKKGSLRAWKESLARCEAASEDAKSGPKLCKCGCNRPAFGRFATCCTKCNGPDGPHAADCLGKGYPKCENLCGRLQFGRFSTCCTHCKGADGPHARDCMDKTEAVLAKGASGGEALLGKGASGGLAPEKPAGGANKLALPEASKRPASGARPASGLGGARPSGLAMAGGMLVGGRNDSKASVSAGAGGAGGAGAGSACGACSKGCGRPPFKHFKTCCTKCQGPEGPHAADCEAKAAEAGKASGARGAACSPRPPDEFQAIFDRWKDLPSGLSLPRFKEVVGHLGLTADEATAMAKEADLNASNVVEQDEFLKWVHGPSVRHRDRETLKDLKL